MNFTDDYRKSFKCPVTVWSEKPFAMLELFSKFHFKFSVKFCKLLKLLRWEKVARKDIKFNDLEGQDAFFLLRRIQSLRAHRCSWFCIILQQYRNTRPLFKEIIAFCLSTRSRWPYFFGYCKQLLEWVFMCI